MPREKQHLRRRAEPPPHPGPRWAAPLLPLGPRRWRSLPPPPTPVPGQVQGPGPRPPPGTLSCSYQSFPATGCPTAFPPATPHLPRLVSAVSPRRGERGPFRRCGSAPSPSPALLGRALSAWRREGGKGAYPRGRGRGGGQTSQGGYCGTRGRSAGNHEQNEGFERTGPPGDRQRHHLETLQEGTSEGVERKWKVPPPPPSGAIRAAPGASRAGALPTATLLRRCAPGL